MTSGGASTVERELLEAGEMLTVSGRRFSLASPRPEDVDVGDIAHALSLTNRFAGHTAVPYNVAQHSVLVARSLRAAGAPTAVVRCGLFHDAAEAYVGDVTRPVKQLLRRGAQVSAFDALEDAVFAAIATRLGLLLPLPAAVHEHDQAMCAREQIDLGRVPPGWVPPVPPAAELVFPWGAHRDREEFLEEHLRCEREVRRG